MLFAQKLKPSLFIGSEKSRYSLITWEKEIKIEEKSKFKLVSGLSKINLKCGQRKGGVYYRLPWISQSQCLDRSDLWVAVFDHLEWFTHLPYYLFKRNGIGLTKTYGNPKQQLTY